MTIEEVIEKEIPKFSAWHEDCREMVKNALRAYKFDAPEMTSRKLMKDIHNKDYTLHHRLNLIEQFGESKFKEGILWGQNKHPKQEL